MIFKVCFLPWGCFFLPEINQVPLFTNFICTVIHKNLWLCSYTETLCITVSLWVLNACISPSLFLACFVSLARCISLCLSAPFRLLFLPPKLLWDLLNIQSLNCFIFILLYHLPSECPASPSIISSPLLPSACILPSCPHRPILQLWINPIIHLLLSYHQPGADSHKTKRCEASTDSSVLKHQNPTWAQHIFEATPLLGWDSNPAKTQIRTQTHGLGLEPTYISVWDLNPWSLTRKGLELFWLQLLTWCQNLLTLGFFCLITARIQHEAKWQRVSLLA